MNIIPNGIWPTMITPFTNEKRIDYTALAELIEWYIQKGVHGLFAVCQSSEMFFLTLDERVETARFVKEKTKGRVPVIASGHISDSIEDQIIELKAMAATGVDGVVLVSNRLVKENESDEIWKTNLKRILAELPEEVKLGFYECPYPYKRLISPELLKWCAETNRFLFLKDTSCDLNNMSAKLRAVKGTGLKIFNANGATFLESLERGVSGYSGVMANFHPDLYVNLMNRFKQNKTKEQETEELSAFLSVASVIECRNYPLCAKYALSLEAIPMELHTRSQEEVSFPSSFKREVEQLFTLTKKYRKGSNE